MAGAHPSTVSGAATVLLWRVFKGSVEGSETENSMWVNQFVSSMVVWEEAGLTIRQASNFPAVSDMPMTNDNVTVKLDFTTTKRTPSPKSVWIRVPFWAKSGTVSVTTKTGNKTVTVKGEPGKFYELAENWNTGDNAIAHFSPTLRSEHISDDRSEYANLSAILYGPLVLCGITVGEYDLVGNKEHLDEWVVPVDNQPLQSIALYTTSADKQYIRHSGFLGWVSAIDPEAGTDAPDATFRVSEVAESRTTTRLVRISSINYPNFFLGHNGDGQIALVPRNGSEAFNKSSTFRQTPGNLNTSSSSTFSLELDAMPGYYISTVKEVDEGNEAGYTPLYVSKMQPGQAFAAASTFTFENGLFQYKPYSFIAHGKNRDYLLQPINSMVDEQYTAYFNITMPTEQPITN